MNLKTTQLDVREKGGSLPQDWTLVSLGILRDNLCYWLEGQNSSHRPTEIIPVGSVESIVTKNRGGGERSCLIEIKAGKKVIQHACSTEEEREMIVEHIQTLKLV
eukprot:TRINITY_DN2979_c0_g1_i6.p1 TRINITY_DN2979_c0_g1~~TRINITY_DN2979_c0_g1_i6.p1  ORF type:complete len:105 (-),score=23.97 TRINITY_DN2979_c0_g1_i6:474-788(-)